MNQEKDDKVQRESSKTGKVCEYKFPLWLTLSLI